jgi:hypothetical protein
VGQTGALLVGTAGAVAVQQALLPVAGAGLAGQMALAVATTFSRPAFATGAPEADWATRPPGDSSARLAYGTMRAVHMPGLVTAVGLYVPYVVILAARIGRSRHPHPGMLSFWAAVGALPMLIHGYRIVFLGTRLF